MKRVADEPGYVLHRYDWSESSLILEVFSRHLGRVAVMAKGAKRPSSNFRPVLLPLQRLHIALGGDAEIRTLKAAEWTGGQVMPTGGALMAGYYLNELLMRLLPRDDAHAELFDAYSAAVALLASQDESLLQPGLRAFELVLLRELGLLPDLRMQTLTLAQLVSDARYSLVPDAGLVETRGDDPTGIEGFHWQSLHQALLGPQPFVRVVHEVSGNLPALKTQLRQLVHYHCGVSMLRTRQLMVDLQYL